MITKADIQTVRSLADKRSREELGLFVAEGRKMVAEAAASGFAVRRIFATQEYADFPGVEITGEKEIGRMSSLRTPQGIIALIEMPRHEIPSDLSGQLVLALDGVQDPGNLGTIIRTADWFGVCDVVCSPSSADCFNPKVVQATMGSLFRVGVHYAELPEFLEKAGTTPRYGTFMEGEDIFSADLGSPATGIVVLGSEGGGITPRTAEALERSGGRRLFIPPFRTGATDAPESLNVGTAAAIVCAEMRRR